MNAEVVMLCGGLGAFLVTLYWVRSRALRERYAIGWLAVSTMLLLAGLFPGPLMMLADYVKMSYPALTLFLALGIVYVYGFFVSISLSIQHRRNTRLTQELAILESRVRDLELRHAAPPLKIGPSPCSLEIWPYRDQAA